MVEVDPRRRAGVVVPGDEEAEQREGPIFWKSITQASFHRRGPPPRSFIPYAFRRPRIAAQVGAGMRVGDASFAFVSPEGSPVARSLGGMSGRRSCSSCDGTTCSPFCGSFMFGLAFSVDRPNPPGNSSAADGGGIFASPEGEGAVRVAVTHAVFLPIKRFRPSPALSRHSTERLGGELRNRLGASHFAKWPATVSCHSVPFTRRGRRFRKSGSPCRALPGCRPAAP
jgi:hypothetical protein